MNRRAILSVLLTAGILVSGVLPLTLQAQTVNDYQSGTGSIVPQCTGASLGLSGSDERECTFCDFMQLVRNILNFIIFLTMVSAGGLFAWAGWLFATSGGSGANHQKARNVFKFVIIGLVIVLGAYTIVDTLMKTLAGGDFTSSWSSLCPGHGVTQ